MKTNTFYLKYKRSTKTERSHLVIWLNGVNIGYLIADKSKFTKVGHNWHIVIKHEGKVYNEPFRIKREAIDFIKTTFKAAQTTNKLT